MNNDDLAIAAFEAIPLAASALKTRLLAAGLPETDCTLLDDILALQSWADQAAIGLKVSIIGGSELLDRVKKASGQ